MNRSLAARRGGKPRRRNPNLDKDRVKEVLKLVASLPGKPSWAEVTTAVAVQLRLPYTRQALSACPEIKLALQARRLDAPARTRDRPVSKRAAVDKATYDQIRRERDANRELAERLIEKFLTWLTNAHTHGLTEADLNRPLPPPGRA